MNLNIISKHRAVIYGIAILYVVLFHASAINDFDYSFGHKILEPFKLFMDTGNVGVDIFLFMSGVSLYFSFSRNNNIAQFFVKRFWRIVPAVWIIFGWFWALLYLFQNFAPDQFIPRFLCIDFWLMTGDASIWYVSLILLLYLLYPLIYAALYGGKTEHTGVKCLILLAFVYTVVTIFWMRNPDFYKPIEIAITRIPVFIMGCYWGKLVFEKRTVSKAFIPLVFIAVFAFYGVLYPDVIHGPLRRFFYAIGGISLCYAIALICEFFDMLFKGEKPKSRFLYRFLAWTGGFTLELYVGHIMCNQAFHKFFDWYVDENLKVYLVMATFAFFLAFGVSKLVPVIQKKITGK